MILRALVTRPLARAPARFLATAAGVAAGVAAVVATLAASRAALSAVREGASELAGGAELEIVRAGGLDETALARLAPLAPLARATPIVEEVALSPRVRDVVRIVGVDPFTAGVARALGAGPAELRAADPDAFVELASGRGAWISADLARETGATPGSTLALDVRARRVELAVAGTFEPPSPSSTLSHLVVVDVALAQEITGRVGRLDRIALTARGGSDPAEIARLAAPLLEPGARVIAPAERARETTAIARSLEFNLTALSGISLLVGAVLVATTLATSVVQRARGIALLRTLGASRGQISRAILFEALAIGALGGALGTLLGFGLARALHASMRATLSTLVAGTSGAAIRLELRDVAAGMGLGVVTALVAAVLPLREGARTPPIQALRGESPRFLDARARGIAAALALVALAVGYELVRLPAWRGLPIAALSGSLAILAASLVVYEPAIDALARAASALPRLPAALSLSCSALAAGRRRAAWAGAAVGVAVALSTSIATMVHSFRESIVEWTDVTMRADLSIRPVQGASGVPVGELDPAILDAAGEILPEGKLDPHYSADGTFRGEPISVATVDYDVVAPRGAFVLVDGGDAIETLVHAGRERAALVNEAFALRYDLRAGDRVAFEVAGVRVDRPIAAVIRDYGDGRGTITIDRWQYLSFVPGDAPRFVPVYLPAGADRDEARARLARGLAARFQVEVLENREIRSRVLDVFERTFAITSALQAVAAIVAVIAVLSVLYALVAERRADLALAASIGASRAQITVQVCAQAGILGLLGASIGSAAGLLVGIVLVAIVQTQSFGWTLAFSMPWSAFLTTIAAVTCACLAAGWLPARSVSRARLVESLRTE